MTDCSTNHCHMLSTPWTLWAHLPHDTNWGNDSYIKIAKFSTVEELIVIYKNLEERLIKNCMLFLMRDDINPTWEDPSNKNGGCFSYKINNKVVKTTWTHLSYATVGETSVNNKNLSNIINGITISPKKNFCIIKIWTNTCDHKNPNIISNITGIESHGCLFKKHIE